MLNQLYKYTALQSTFGVQMLALVDGEPRTLPLKKALQIFIEHRQTVIVRRSNFELAKARARLHILDGYLIALGHLDAVIKTIRESQDADVAKTNLMQRFKLSELQAQAILDMQLRRLAALERKKIEDEHKQVTEQIAYLEDLLAHPKKILALIQTDLKELAEKYGDDRRTRIAAEATEELSEADLVQDEAVLISLTERGYVKRVAASVFRSQSRGGRGVMGHTTKDEDEVVMLDAGSQPGFDAVLLRPWQGLFGEGLSDPGCRSGRQGHSAGQRAGAGRRRAGHRRHRRLGLLGARLLHAGDRPRQGQARATWRSSRLSGPPA